MNESLDLTSNGIDGLPVNVIETILSSLPVRDAVRTTILSKKWRYAWVGIPKLVFDDTLFKKSAVNQRPNINKLIFTIYQVLLLHHGPIHEFTLSISELESCSEIDQLILHLSRNSVEKFTLYIWKGELYKVPSSLFSCMKLMHLNLRSCVFKPPMTFRGLSKLTCLEFDEVIVAPEVFGNFISSCPLLERLSLISSAEFDYLEINAPKLRYLCFRVKLKSLRLKNVLLLVDVSIALKQIAEVEYVEERETSDVILFFDCLRHIENLLMGYHFLKILAAGGVPQKLPASLVHLKFLELEEIFLGALDEISFTFCLIRSSPNLEKITVKMFGGTAEVLGTVLDFLLEQDYSDVNLNQLRVVKIEGLSGMHPELEFVKLLLTKSPKLEKMLIDPNLGNVADKGLQMLKDLIQFERASPKAKIIFGDY